MIWIFLGLALWIGAHLFKRIAPEPRAKLGEPGKGLMALLMIAGIALMTIGYKQADTAVFWGRSGALVGINNLLMVLAVYLFEASGMKTAITGRLRHPQLTAMKVFCFAHLLVNGDVASFVLFGGLLAWAVASVIIINKQDGKPPLPAREVVMGKEIGAAVGAVVVTVVIMVVHNWLGAQPWG
jgi:uncharacterized membrane protein